MTNKKLFFHNNKFITYKYFNFYFIKINLLPTNTVTFISLYQIDTNKYTFFKNN